MVIAELLWAPASVVNESVVSGLEKEIDKDGILVLVTALELVASEVIVWDEVTVVGRAELASFPVLVVVDSVKSDPPWENVRSVLGRVTFVSVRWVIPDVVVICSLEDILSTVEKFEVPSVPVWVSQEVVLNN